MILTPQTKPRWTAAPAPRTLSSTTCWSSCSPATGRWRSASPAPSASTTTSSWSSSVATPPASTAAPRSRPAPSAGRPSGSGSSCLSELQVCVLLRPPAHRPQRRTPGRAAEVRRSRALSSLAAAPHQRRSNIRSTFFLKRRCCRSLRVCRYILGSFPSGTAEEHCFNLNSCCRTGSEESHEAEWTWRLPPF